MSRVEPFATRIKIESSDRSTFWKPIKVTSKLGIKEKFKTCDCNLTFDPLKIKRSRALEENNEAIKHASLIKSLDTSYLLLCDCHCVM